VTGIEEGQADEEKSTSLIPSATSAAATPPGTAATPVDLGKESETAEKKPILIGSQRDPAAYRARPKRDWAPIDSDDRSKDAGREGGNRARQQGGRGSYERPEPERRRQPAPQQGAQNQVATPRPQTPLAPIIAPISAPQDEIAIAPKPPAIESERAVASVATSAETVASPTDPAGAGESNLSSPISRSLPPEPLFPEPVLRESIADDDSTPVLPGRRQKLTSKMEAELERAMGGMSLDDLMSGGESGGQQEIFEPESRHKGRVAAVRKDEIFVDLGGRQQGCLSSRTMETVPQPGEMIEVIVQRFNAEEGLYDLSLPGASVELGNWDEVHEGMLVDVQITGHNTGGLECEINHIRGFIPVSQVSLYRVEDLAQFVGQRFTCLITDANPARKNLVLSRRAVLEREKEEKKQAFFEALAPGQVYEGTVRKLMDFGAFVELGNGLDGLLHISQLSWGRVKHPSEVLQEGQAVRVRVEKIDRETGRIGLSYREMIDNPWSSAASKYPHNAIVHGKVTRLMEFGAFVEVEPGIEGLVHISELSHKRIWRASDVVKEGDEVDVLVLSVNPDAQRMSLSIKGLSKPEPTKKEKEEAEEAELPVAASKTSRPSNQPLKGGLGKTSGGESFGLKW
jgi:predicted RNA-binding protein with RPS1 domain